MKTMIINASIQGKSFGFAQIVAKNEGITEFDVLDMSVETENIMLTGKNMGTFFNDKDKFLAAVKDYDRVIIATSISNYTYNSLLKAFFDKVTISGYTFHYTENGPAPLNTFDAKVSLVLTSGSPKEFEPKVTQMTPELIESSLNFIGVKLNDTMWIDGVDMPDTAGKSLEEIFEMRTK